MHFPFVSEAATVAPTFNMKYIRHKKFGFILFEPSVGHDAVARRLGGPDDILSAGFVFAPKLDLKCLGYSSSLNVGAASDDASDLRSRMSTY